MNKQSLLEGDLLLTNISKELDLDLRVLPLPKLLKKYTDLIPRYELLGYVTAYLSGELARQLIKDRVGNRLGGSREDPSIK